MLHERAATEDARRERCSHTRGTLSVVRCNGAPNMAARLHIDMQAWGESVFTGQLLGKALDAGRARTDKLAVAARSIKSAKSHVKTDSVK